MAEITVIDWCRKRAEDNRKMCNKQVVIKGSNQKKQKEEVDETIIDEGMLPPPRPIGW
ncbi:hypothetical protein HOD96_01715 [Candidatus Falkowbacteria bacterium]|jgi:hypothetical protein|nr:hypothetical protein [Candidatus Falkowbacteria bacterium]MBT4433335.1 hypothetical protein [Candidatus Falkowbacteria bacterium]